MCVLLHLPSTVCKVCLLCACHRLGNLCPTAASRKRLCFYICIVYSQCWHVVYHLSTTAINKIKVRWVTDWVKFPPGGETHKSPKGTAQTLIKKLAFMSYFCTHTHVSTYSRGGQQYVHVLAIGLF